MNIVTLLAVIMLNCHCGLLTRCPDLLPCKCLWDIVPTTTLCRINILHLKSKSGIVQAETEKLILQVGDHSQEMMYNSDVWPKLYSVITTGGRYTCRQGICYLQISPNTANPWIVTKKRIPKMNSKTLKPACFTTNADDVMDTTKSHYFTTNMVHTCSTSTVKPHNEKKAVDSRMLYVPLICVVSFVLMIGVVVLFRRFRFRSPRSDTESLESETSMTLYMSSSPSVMGLSFAPDAEVVETKFTSPIASRTRSQRAPISSRLRSTSKQE